MATPLKWLEYGNGTEYWDTTDRFGVYKNMNGWYCVDAKDYSDSDIVKTKELAMEWAESRRIEQSLAVTGSGQQSEEF